MAQPIDRCYEVRRGFDETWGQGFWEEVVLYYGAGQRRVREGRKEWVRLASWVERYMII
jgi:hypothetical protein